jgi:hypothetical protein
MVFVYLFNMESSKQGGGSITLCLGWCKIVEELEKHDYPFLHFLIHLLGDLKKLYGGFC